MKLSKKIYLKYESYLYKIYLKYIKKYVQLSSDPYISGDTFKKLSDHRLDELSNVNIKKVKSNEIIFVKTDYFEKFINEYLQHLPNNLKILLHNSDINVETYNESLKNKNVILFSQNLNLSTKDFKNIYPLPIGFENRSWLKNGKLKNLNFAKNIKTNKQNKIISSFNTKTNISKRNLLSTLANYDHVNLIEKLNNFEYLNTLSKYKLALCPEGNGIDTHRIWECLLVKTLPIVLKTNFSRNLYREGVPLLEIGDWEELQNYDQVKIENTYLKFEEKLEKQEFININFWKNYIYEK